MDRYNIAYDKTQPIFDYVEHIHRLNKYKKQIEQYYNAYIAYNAQKEQLITLKEDVKYCEQQITELDKQIKQTENEII